MLVKGTVLLLHPITARLSASDGFNCRSGSIEFVGNFASSEGRWWRPETYGANVVSAEQVEAGRALLRALAGIGVRYVFAHRQSSETGVTIRGRTCGRTIASGGRTAGRGS